MFSRGGRGLTLSFRTAPSTHPPRRRNVGYVRRWVTSKLSSLRRTTPGTRCVKKMSRLLLLRTPPGRENMGARAARGRRAEEEETTRRDCEKSRKQRRRVDERAGATQPGPPIQTARPRPGPGMAGPGSTPGCLGLAGGTGTGGAPVGRRAKGGRRRRCPLVRAPFFRFAPLWAPVDRPCRPTAPASTCAR